MFSIRAMGLSVWNDLSSEGVYSLHLDHVARMNFDAFVIVPFEVVGICLAAAYQFNTCPGP